MPAFCIRFFICNFFIAIAIGVIMGTKRLLKNYLSGRIQYNLWFLLLILLSVPFLPVPDLGRLPVLPWLAELRNHTAAAALSDHTGAGNLRTNTMDWLNDFSVSVGNKAASSAGLFLLAIWLGGMLVMLLFVVKARIRLYQLEKSGLPLQNRAVYKLFLECMQHMDIPGDIPIYSTAFLRSPVIAGLLNPRIYIPIHLISDFNPADMRYMLMHELQHYKHMDNLSNYLMTLAGILYWFNPFVWAALREMKNDCEIACDCSVLQMLDKDSYMDYGNTLLNMAEKISSSPFPFAAGMGGNKKQIKKRIINIVSYHPQSLPKRINGVLAYILIALLLLTFAPMLSAYAADRNYSPVQENRKAVSYIDLASNFEGCDGSFVLYDAAGDSWQIYNRQYSALRIPPSSTYKIYSALLGLEQGIITPKQSGMKWDKTNHAFEAWNRDHDLYSAMANSVNWYFQSIDRQLGSAAVKDYIQKIGYGNKAVKGELSTYWMDSLKISPIEQVQLLHQLYNNEFGFDEENIKAVKQSLLLYDTPDGALYGKTGTGLSDGVHSGWFIGFIERPEQTCFFAVNLVNHENAKGTAAAGIALSALSKLGLWEQ